MKHNFNYRRLKEWSEFGYVKRIELSFFDTLNRRIVRHYKKNIQNILDIGFGNGQLLSYYASKKINVYGLELDAESISLAKKAGYNAFNMNNFHTIKNIDVIFILDVLEHNSTDSCIELLINANSVLNDGGLVIIKCPNGDSPLGLRNQNGDVTHVNYIGSGKIKALAKLTNYTVIDIFPEPEPIITKSIKHSLHRLITFPIKLISNYFINLVFFPGNKTYFLSQNIMAILKKNY